MGGREGGRTDVANELDQQVHVDLIRVHELQHLPGSAAEVIQIRTEVPSGTRVFQDHLLDQTQRQRSAHHRHFLLRGGWSEDGTWCWKVLPPFCVTDTVISSSSSRIFWLYSESFSRT